MGSKRFMPYGNEAQPTFSLGRSKQRHLAGLLARGSSYSLILPGGKSQWLVKISSPHTVAGQLPVQRDSLLGPPFGGHPVLWILVRLSGKDGRSQGQFQTAVIASGLSKIFRNLQNLPLRNQLFFLKSRKGGNKKQSVYDNM
jgi:hypothetical protein